MQNPDLSISYLKAADTKPSLLLQGETPRLLDEWQTAQFYGMEFASWLINEDYQVSLFNGKTDIDSFSSPTIEQIAIAIVRGGWPASIIDNANVALRHAVDYVEAIINADVSR